LLNIPAIKAVKETFKGSRVILAVDPYVKELAANISCADEVIAWRNGKHSLLEIIKFSNALKEKNIDIAIVMNPSKDTNIAVYLAGIPVRAGYDHKWSFLLTKKMKDLKHLGQKHEVEYNLELVGLVGAETASEKRGQTHQQINIRVGSDPIFPTGLVGSQAGFIVVHPWTSDDVKQWPVERFRELALRIVKETDSDVLIVGGPEELQKSAIFNDLDKRIKNLTGKTTLVELASVLKKSKLLISGDSGPVHLASAVGAPVIALFRNDIPGKGPKRWGPWGEGHIVIEKKSLLDISVDEVVKAAINLVL